MALVHDQLKCGGCGGVEHRLENVRKEEDGRDVFRRIRVICVKCESVSEIAVSAKLTVSNVSGDGTLCGGWREESEDTTEPG